MANLRLKKSILEVVENQLRDNEPPEVKKAYEALRDAGYSVSEAKEKIGAVVIEEIYAVMKEGQPYDEARYIGALKEMVQQCVDFEDDHEITTEWDQWDELVQAGYEAEAVQEEETLISSWWKAWGIFQEIMKAAEQKMSVMDVMESQDFAYPIDAWLQDLEMELGNAGEHEKRSEFCRAVLDMFDWTYDDGSNFTAAIGEELYAAGKVEEGKEWFVSWLKKEPHNANAWSVYSWCIEKHEGAENAYKFIRRQVIGVSCTLFNELLFRRAENLAERLGKQEDLQWIKGQLKAFENEMEKTDLYNDRYDDFQRPAQQPIKKEKKIYPNDPCPCGSGKKYKKCCGKK